MSCASMACGFTGRGTISSPSAATSATEGLTVPTGKLESVQAVPEAPTNYPAIQYLKTRAGELVPVLKGVELEGYLKYLETLRIPETARVDSWSIGRLSLEGEASAEFAELTAKFEIQILENEKTVFIPLRLNEATLRDAGALAVAGDAAQAAQTFQSASIGVQVAQAAIVQLEGQRATAAGRW